MAPVPHKSIFATQRKSIRSKPLQILLHRAAHKLARKHVQQYPPLAIFAFDHIGLSINVWGRYENDALMAAVDFLKSKQVCFSGAVLDIGANIGNHSIFFSELFEKVYAFEPNCRTFELLKFNSQDRKIHPYNFGLSDQNTVAEFFQSTTNVGGSHVLSSAPKNGTASTSVNLKRLDDLDELKDSDISIIKIDVEGHESQVLNGGRDLLSKAKPVVLFEQTLDEIRDGTSKTIAILTELGYEFYVSRKNFTFGRNTLAKGISFFLRYVFGEATVFVQVDNFEKKFYDMIIAFPTTSNTTSTNQNCSNAT